MKVNEIFERKEAIRYLFWGVVTVLVNYFSYLLLEQFLMYQAANLVSIVITKVFAYCTNKKFVFRTKTNCKEQILEVLRYIFGRGFTGVVDFFGLILLVDILLINDKLGKIIMIVITTILNYFCGKIYVFKKPKNGN